MKLKDLRRLHVRSSIPMIRRMFFAVLLMAFSYMASAQAQVYVNIRPSYGPMARPAPPSRAHVWIGEDWVWQGGRYVPAGGRWVLPPHPGYVWVPGRWMHYRRGWQWIPGRWKRGRRY